MIENITNLSISVVEAIIFWLVLRNSSKANFIPKVIVVSFLACIFSFFQALVRYQTGEYSLFDLTVMYFIFSAVNYAILITILVFSTPKNSKTLSTTNSVTLTMKNSARITKNNRLVLIVTIANAGIYFHHVHSGNVSPTLFNYFDAFSFWRSGDVNLLTGIPCLRIINIDLLEKTMIVEPEPGYTINV